MDNVTTYVISEAVKSISGIDKDDISSRILRERKDGVKKHMSFPAHECPGLSKKRTGDVFYTTRVSDDYDRFGDDDLLSLDFGKHNANGRKCKTGRITKVWDIKNAKDHPFYGELTDSQKNFLSKYRRIKVLQITVL